MNVVFSYGKFKKEVDAKRMKAESQNINIRVYHGDFDFRRSIGQEISLKDWDFKRGELKLSGVSRTPEEHKYIQSLKEQLEDIKRAYDREFLELKLSHRLKSLDSDSWKEWAVINLKKGLGIVEEDREGSPLLLDKYDEYIKFKQRTWKPNTLRNNNSAYNMLTAFMDFQKFVEFYAPEGDELKEWEKWYITKYGKSKAKEYKTDETDMTFYNNLQDWNIKKGNGLSGAFSDQVKHIKAMLKYFESVEGLKIHHNINHREFKAHISSPDHDILSSEEIQSIFKYKGKKYLENVVSLAKIQYHACMRYDELRSELEKGVDALNIQKTSEGYIWNLLQGKVSKRKSVPVHKEIIDMFQNGTFPHLISDQKYREYIKELLAILQINKTLKIGTHTFRRSFCTNMFNAGHSFQEISQYSGHSTEKQLREYIQAKNVLINNTIPTE
jgi:integrase